jgi:His-Xaa-Ser system radical SAM maturase HxsB
MIYAPVNDFPRRSRKFLDAPAFQIKEASGYFLLPFRFHRLNADKEVLVNEVGDFLVVPTGSVARIVNRELIRDEDLYQDLIANFFISEERIPSLLELIATRYRTKKSFLDHFTALHIFVITLRCEHTCHYCQVSRANENQVSFDMKTSHIDKGIEFMMKSPNQHVTMEFQGGEPLLAFDKIVYAVGKAQKAATHYHKEVSFVICSNLAVIDDEMLSFCKENKILISTSLDGPASVHNANRHRPGRNSYELAINGIQRCREVLGYDQVSALLTTTKRTLENPIAIVDEYFERGFRSIFLRPISPYGFATKNERKNKYQAEEFLAFYKAAMDRILEYNLNGEFYREEFAAIILRKMLTPFPVGYVDLQSPAGMINNVIVFNYDGHIYASDESRMLAESKDFTFQLGYLGSSTYEDIFYGDKATAFSAAWTNESLAGCSECAFQSYCGADPVMNHATQGDIFGFRPTSSFCQRNMEIIRYLLELMDTNPAIAAIFRNWTGGPA